MTTRANLRDLIRRRVADEINPFSFSNTIVNQFINDAIQQYSLYFPRILEGTNAETINLNSNSKIYTLTTPNIQAILAVEYPIQSPPSYILPKAYTAPDFNSGLHYATIGHPPSAILLSFTPGNGESMAVSLAADHLYPTNDDDIITVPDQHLELITLYGRYLIHSYLATKEATNPDRTTIISNTLMLNSFRALRDYTTLLEHYQMLNAPSTFINWSEIGL